MKAPSAAAMLLAALMTLPGLLAPTQGERSAREAARPGAPELVVEAPASYQGLARRLREMDPGQLAVVGRLVGLDRPNGPSGQSPGARPGPPIRVLLAPEGSSLAAAVPPWVSGYADGVFSTVVLLPARTPSYPDSSLEDLLRHEVAHVLLTRAAGGRPLPRWFHEGVATIAGTSWNLDDRSYLALAMIGEKGLPLAEVEQGFTRGEGEARRAYAVAGAFTRDLLERHGSEVLATILAGVREGLPFEEAFARATGAPLATAEARFWSDHSFWYRWVPIATSSAALWMGITLLALLAFRRRRARDAAQRRIWEEEEAEERRRLAAEKEMGPWGPM